MKKVEANLQEQRLAMEPVIVISSIVTSLATIAMWFVSCRIYMIEKQRRQDEIDKPEIHYQVRLQWRKGKCPKIMFWNISNTAVTIINHEFYIAGNYFNVTAKTYIGNEKEQARLPITIMPSMGISLYYDVDIIKDILMKDYYADESGQMINIYDRKWDDIRIKITFNNIHPHEPQNIPLDNSNIWKLTNKDEKPVLMSRCIPQ